MRPRAFACCHNIDKYFRSCATCIVEDFLSIEPDCCRGIAPSKKCTYLHISRYGYCTRDVCLCGGFAEVESHVHKGLHVTKSVGKE